MTTYTRDQVETACCLWEAIIELRGENVELDHAFRRHGTSEMRIAVIGLAVECDEEWQELTQDAKDDIGAFDWEYCPGFIKRVDWTQWPPVVPAS